MRITLGTLLCWAVTTACGGSSPSELVDTGQRALASQDYADAAESFDAALEAIGPDTSHPEFLRAKLGSIEALTQLDAGRARDEFLELAGALPSKVTDRDFSLIASRLGQAGGFEEATAVLTVGIEAFPESPHLIVQRDKIGDQAQAEGSSEALEALRGLGYVGDGG